MMFPHMEAGLLHSLYAADIGKDYTTKRPCRNDEGPWLYPVKERFG